MNRSRSRLEANALLPPLPSAEGRGEGDCRGTFPWAATPSELLPVRVSSNSPAPQPSPQGRGGKCGILVATALILIFALATRAENWPQWRGPRGDGTSVEANIPTTWSPTQNVRWKTPIPGKGHSSPVIYNDQIFLTTCLENSLDRQVLCLDRATGKVLWTKIVLKAPLEQKHNLNSYSSATPATDGKYLWVAFFERPTIELV